jgi:hypothetical protein
LERLLPALRYVVADVPDKPKISSHIRHSNQSIMSGPETILPLAKAGDIGMKQLRTLSNLPMAKRLDLIAEGLPLLLRSAEDLYRARTQVGPDRRVSQILLGHATEEAAKILILLDYVRCPSALNARAQGQLSAFYDHGARLIYAQACRWRPDTVATLREYVDRTRASHAVEGNYGEYIVPNWELYTREARLYADLTRTDTGALVWNDPTDWPVPRDLFGYPPAALAVTRSLARVGALSRQGLDVIRAVWSETAFRDPEHASTSDELIQETLRLLIESGLPAEEATDVDVRTIYSDWQMPMYAIDVQIQPADLERLRAEQEAHLRSLY